MVCTKEYKVYVLAQDTIGTRTQSGVDTRGIKGKALLMALGLVH